MGVGPEIQDARASAHKSFSPPRAHTVMPHGLGRVVVAAGHACHQATTTAALALTAREVSAVINP
jgi:uridylate kinase